MRPRFSRNLFFTIPLNHTTTFTYESTFNQIATVIDPLSHTTTFGYDAKGNLMTMTNTLSKITTAFLNRNPHVPGVFNLRHKTP